MFYHNQNKITISKLLLPQNIMVTCKKEIFKNFNSPLIPPHKNEPLFRTNIRASCHKWSLPIWPVNRASDITVGYQHTYCGKFLLSRDMVAVYNGTHRHCFHPALTVCTQMTGLDLPTARHLLIRINTLFLLSKRNELNSLANSKAFPCLEWEQMVEWATFCLETTKDPIT